MNKSTRVALQGFSRAERSTFESFFALAGQRTPSYTQEAEPSRAHFILVDADDAASCKLLAARGLMRRAVALGSAPQPAALMQLPRPINLMLVVRALDALPRSAARPRTPSGADPNAMVDAGDTQPSDAIERVLQELAYRTLPLPGGVDYRAGAGSASGHSAAGAQAGGSAGVSAGAAARAPDLPSSAAPRMAARAPEAGANAALRTSRLAPPAALVPAPAYAPTQRALVPTAPVRPHSHAQAQAQSISRGTTPAAGPMPAAPRAARRADADLAPDLERPATGSTGAARHPLPHTEAPTMTSVDIPVWADARAIAASLAAQAAAEAWPTIGAPQESSAALWLPDLEVGAAVGTTPAPAPTPAPHLTVALPLAPVTAQVARPVGAPAWVGGPGAQATNPFPTLPPIEPPSAVLATAAAPKATAIKPETPAAPAMSRAWLSETSPLEPATTLSRPPQAANVQPHPLEVGGSASPAHVLVVDDGELALRFITNQLKRYGFQVHVAREPREALAQLQARRYEFVFVEINMEADSHFPVTQAVRQVPLGPGEKAPAVVLLADRHSHSELQTAANAGADAWLSTPLLEAELLKLIGPRSAPPVKAVEAELSGAASA